MTRDASRPTDPHSSLTPSAALADRYRIERELGAGGMATVYLAEDLKHHRKVAIKVLHAELSAVLGPERFLKEIELTASLQHPHILPLFDSGSADGLLYYVMPYVEGESLRNQLARETQLPVPETLRIATEVADALEYAHRRGVVHRDIKPENVLLHDGHALVADFGIALAVEHAGGQRMTQTGLSLGTPQYMSPEQAMGERSITARSDIYALGVMTYEMLAGSAPFTGPNSQAIVAQILTSEPPALRSHRRSVPEHVDFAVRTALEKLPADRFGSAAEFAAALADGAAIRGVSRAGEMRRDRAATGQSLVGARFVWATAVVAVLVAIVAAVGWFRSSRAASHQEVTRFRIPVAPPGDDGAQIIAISPDGRTIAYTDRSASDKAGIYLRRLDRSSAELLPGTGRADALSFSPDGASIAYTTFDAEVRVIPVAGGTSVPVARGAAWFAGIDWGSDGYLYFASNDSGVIMRVRATGGSSEAVTKLETSKMSFGFKAHQSPRLIGGGRGVAFSVFRGPGRIGDIGIVDLRTRRWRFVAKGAAAIGARDGHLLFVTNDGTLEAMPFDEHALEPRGAPVPLTTGIVVNEARADVALARDGTLIYVAALAPASQLVWVSRDGVESPLGGIIDKSIGGVAISPAGDRVALGEGQEKSAVWLYDIRNQTLSAFAHSGPLDYRPSWTPDGSSIVFVSDRGSATATKALWIQPVDGRDTARLLVTAPRHAQEISWVARSPWVVYRVGFDDARTGRDLRYFRPPDTTSRAYLATAADEMNPALSPDGRWLAYVSNESGSDQVYVGAFPGPGARTQVSDAGGEGPLWSHDGRKLFYRAADGRFMSVDVTAGARLELSNRRALFSTRSYVSDRTHQPYDIAADDRHFLFVKPSSEPALDVVVHWYDEARVRLGKSR
jgi:Tol biopolymer transport system component